MRALTWRGKRDVRVDTVPGSGDEGRYGHHRPDHIHRYLRFGPPSVLRGDRSVPRSRRHPRTRAHGVVEEVGGAVASLAVGDRVVIPFNLSCGHCFTCQRGLQSQSDTTQVRERGMGAVLSATPSCTAKCRAGRRSSSGSPSGTAFRSRSCTGRPTSGTSICPTSYPPPGRRWSVRTSCPAPSLCWGSDRSARWSPVSPCTGARAWSSASSSGTPGWLGPLPAAST